MAWARPAVEAARRTAATTRRGSDFIRDERDENSARSHAEFAGQRPANKSQIPGSKSQGIFKSKKSKVRTVSDVLRILFPLRFPWDLGFGIWDFLISN